MRKMTLLVTLAALALAGGCNKKDKEAKKAPPVTTTPTPTTTTTTTTPTPPPPPPKPVTLTGVDLAKRYIDCHGYFSSSDKDKFKDCFAADATSRFLDSMQPESKGAEAITSYAMEFHAAFPDGKIAPQLVLVNGREVASVVLFTGTNTAPMKGMGGEMPATNKKVGVNLLHMVTFDDANRVKEEWWILDDNTLAYQLGYLPKDAPPQRSAIEKGLDQPEIVIANDSDAEKTNLAMVQKGNETFGSHDLKAMLADWAPDAIESDQGGPADTTGVANIEKGTKMFLTAFPDGTITARKSWAAGQYVVNVGTFAGTNTGPMGKMKKTGKPVSMTVGEVVKLDQGKIKQLWRFYNGHAMASQLGWIDDSKMAPPGGGAGTGTGAGTGAGMGTGAGTGTGMGTGAGTGMGTGAGTGATK
jgi:predicted ester cyclase